MKTNDTQIFMFNCATVEDADTFIAEHKIKYDESFTTHNWDTNTFTKTWYRDTRYAKGDEGTKKVAHYVSKTKKLYIYCKSKKGTSS